jgi:CheY-like chemotaxis protein
MMMEQTLRTGGWILIVDDDADSRETLGALLELEGYRAVGAANGQEALDRLAGSEPPCIILLDLMMPRMNGWEFRERQQQDPRLSNIPVAIMTGVRDSAAQSARLNAAEFFQKPLDFNALKATISNYCQRLPN